MDYSPFSGSKPNLINEKIIKKLNKILKENKLDTSFSNSLYDIYQNYIKPNAFGIIVFIVICVFLFMKYIIKQYKQNKKNKKNDYDDDDNNDKGKNKGNIKIEKFTEIEEQEINKDNDYLDMDINSRIKEDRTNSDTNFNDINDEYEEMLRNNNNGYMSSQMIKDMYEKNKEKHSFNEMTKIIVEGGE